MASSRRLSFSGWFRTFNARLIANEQKIKLSLVFWQHWSHELSAGRMTCTDPRKNTVEVELIVNEDDVAMIYGGSTIQSFHQIRPDEKHCIVFHYVGGRDFQIRVYSCTKGEISYPEPDLIASWQKPFEWRQFFRTSNVQVDHNKDVLYLNNGLHYMCEEPIQVGNARITDQEGNSHIVQLSKDETGRIYISSGIQALCNFYGENRVSHMYIHYTGLNQFQVRLFDSEKRELEYPIFIDSDVESNQNMEEDVDEGDAAQFEQIDENQGPPQHGSDSCFDPEERGWFKEVNMSVQSAKQIMVILANIVRKFGLDNVERVYLHDCYGGVYDCPLMGGKRRKQERYIGSGWYDFVKDHMLEVGHLIYFWLPADDDQIIQVRVM